MRKKYIDLIKEAEDEGIEKDEILPTPDEIESETPEDTNENPDEQQSDEFENPDEYGEEVLTIEDLGKRYELKRIYSRLVVLNNHLSVSTDKDILKVRNQVVDAIEMFGLVVKNIDLYEDRINEIIIGYYRFILSVYRYIKQYEKKKYEEKEEIKKKEEKKQKTQKVEWYKISTPSVVKNKQ